MFEGATGPRGPLGPVGATGPTGVTGATGATGGAPVVFVTKFKVFDVAGPFTFDWPDPDIPALFVTMIGAGGGGGGGALVDGFGGAGGGGAASGGAVVRFSLFNNGLNPTLTGVVGAGGTGGAGAHSATLSDVDAGSGQDGESTSITFPNSTRMVAPGGGGGSGGSVHPSAVPPEAAGGTGGPGLRPEWQPIVDNIMFAPVPFVTGLVVSSVENPGGAGAMVTPFEVIPSHPGFCGPFAPLVSGLSSGLPSLLPHIFQSFGKTAASGGGGGANVFNIRINQSSPGSYGGPAALPYMGYPSHADPPKKGQLADGGGGGDMLILPLVGDFFGSGGAGGHVDTGAVQDGETGSPGIVVFEW